ncbi:MAG: hypothetical protein JW882_21990 [Deltaproteobacteria bacterium]|nr:hypothetical protein [Deltaproteobacteria bacterium]
MATIYPQKSVSRTLSHRNPAGENSRTPIKKMAVLFTDIVGSSKYFKEHGDLAGRMMLKQHQDISSPVITEFGGFVVKFLGDSVMAYFLDPCEALKAAIKIQQSFLRFNCKKENEGEIHVRICIHYGDGIEEEKDIFGDVVNMAAKFLPLANGDQIFVSQELREQVNTIPSVKYRKVEIPNSTKLPGNIDLFMAMYDENMDFKPKKTILMLFKPVWTLDNKNFRKAWNHFLGSRKTLFNYSAIYAEDVLDDKSLALIVKNSTSAYEFAGKSRTCFKDFYSGEDSGQLIPLQIVIDSGTYLRAGRIILENLRVDWNKIRPGGVHVSSCIYDELLNHTTLHGSMPDHKKSGGFIEITSCEVKHRGDQKFLFKGALIQGDCMPCFYCGDRRHISSQCPSKNIMEATSSISGLGYLSLEDLNSLFFNYLNSKDIESLSFPADNITQNPDDIKKQIAKLAFYELKSVYQLGFFRTIWDLKTEDWNKIRSSTDDRNKGGLLWIGLDCIRVSNTEQAEFILRGELKNNPEDYRVYCAMGFLMIEENDHKQAKKYFKRALEFTQTIPQRIFLLFLISRTYYLDGDDKNSRHVIKEIIRISPYCHEALYQDIVLRFRKGDESVSLHHLNKLIKINRDYYVVALIDPELSDFSETINPLLSRLLAERKDRAARIMAPAKDALEKLRQALGEREKEVLEAKSLMEKMEQLSKVESYFGLIDTIHYGESIINIGERSINIRRKKVSRVIFDLKEGLSKMESRIGLINYPSLTRSVSLQIRNILEKLDRNWDIIESCDSEEFKKILDFFDELASDLGRIRARLEKLESTAQILRFANRFFKKSILIQSANLIVALIVLPIIVHYLNFILPDINIIPRDMWYYQKIFVGLGALLGLILGILMSRDES